MLPRAGKTGISQEDLAEEVLSDKTEPIKAVTVLEESGTFEGAKTRKAIASTVAI